MKERKVITKAHPNIKLIYASQICLGAIFTLPVFLLYYHDKMGLTFQDFLLGEALFAIVILCLEVPTGWLSDKWSRKGTLISGFLFLILGYTLLLYANSFWDAMLAQATLGVAVALASGTNSALVYDTLLETGNEDQFSRIEGKKFALGMYSTVIASLTGGVLYTTNIHLPLIFDIITLAIGLICLCFVTEPSRHKQIEPKHPIKDMMETIHFTVKGHIDIAGIVMVVAILFTATKLITWGQQDYFRYIELDPVWFGVIVGIGCLFGGLGGQFGHIIEARFRDKHILMGLWVVLMGILFIVGYITTIYALPLLIVGATIYGFANPRVQSAINKRVGSERRAAILSTANMMVNLLFIPLSLIAGWITKTYHIGITFMVLSVWLLISGGFAFSLWSKRSR